ncbi:neprilysin-2-like isoform X2 [Photinus pyralis]|uniref:neprilysin-2-like isoform X2 n=1 Tax=Photinus pyralis TaxID=7054 RepID=UPI001266FA75|nr:neprilysin-2-like isoform X2 [Photinus pyralis]
METYLILSVAVNIALVGTDVASNQISNLCLTPGCIQAASSILDNIDASVDPCDDFYQFACGNFIKQANDDTSYVELTENLVQQQLRVVLEENVKAQEPRPFRLLKKMYQACMNTTAIELDGLTTIKSILEDLGGWPVLKGRKWNQKKFDWKQSVYKFRNLGYAVNYLIGVRITKDITNSSLTTLYIGHGAESLSNTSDLKPYLNKMVYVATVLGAKKGVAERELNESLKFEHHLSLMASAIPEQRNLSLGFEYNTFKGLRYYRISVSELQQIVPYIPWLEYLNSVLNIPNITIKASQEIIFEHPIYFSDLEKLLNNTPKRVLANYLMWKVVELSIPYITEKLEQYECSTFRWSTCVSLTLDSALYVRKHFHEDNKQEVTEMVSNIKKEFAKNVKGADWMDNDTKLHALEKLAAMSSHVGYPDELLSDKKLEDYYKGLHVESDNFLKIRLSTELFLYEAEVKRLVIVLPVNEINWVDRAKRVLEVNAFYHIRANSIELPAAQLQSIILKSNRPRYINYGAVGYVIAHEITHGFSGKGSTFDKDGKLVDWWESSTKEKFKTKVQCMIDQYGNYSVPELGLNLNGLNTIGENIADNGGMRYAYLAYNEWVRRNGKEPLLPALNYTDRQLFWISAANGWCANQIPSSVKRQIHNDEHPPYKFRVNVPLSNTDYFAKDFNCRIGSNMNPVGKCEVWRSL